MHVKLKIHNDARILIISLSMTYLVVIRIIPIGLTRIKLGAYRTQIALVLYVQVIVGRITAFHAIGNSHLVTTRVKKAIRGTLPCCLMQACLASSLLRTVVTRGMRSMTIGLTGRGLLKMQKSSSVVI